MYGACLTDVHCPGAGWLPGANDCESIEADADIYTYTGWRKKRGTGFKLKIGTPITTAPENVYTNSGLTTYTFLFLGKEPRTKQRDGQTDGR